MAMPDGHEARLALVLGARACVGMRFRPQGRGVGGIDCLGVVAAAAAAAGIRLPVGRDYRLTGHCLAGLEAALRAAGCMAVQADRAMGGDLLLAVPAPGQAHFAVRTDRGLVEAHAGIGRVVERPLGPGELARDWTAWRLPAAGALAGGEPEGPS